MHHKFGKTIVMALGGSIVYPSEINSRFIRDFKRFVERFVKKGYKFVIVVGGGSICRVYQKAAAEVAPLTDEDKDWLGIHVTRLNAHLIRTIFRDIANPVVIDTRGKIKKLNHAVTVGSGWHPGSSTDHVATALASDFKIPEVVIIGKPDHVYDKDPNKFKGAKPLPQLSWKAYRKLIPSEWTPGFHSPVDPLAARFGQKEGIDAIIVNGDLKNLQALLEGKEFRGTVIS